ncbi:exodeoxyribonuclease III [Enterobacteriaceae endosymbiont of Macroplea appendiculata]|uniref:exodeoxyribonuclease III n=1 Tax=Enterobacteriaceae endosymbiont of Macroplea appendiculata TaxID=2675790 RepID=UPI0014496BAC|nr:exodeoxyribonuclease III [Enterobacteriaceae endosymbiont of Macroplea appendiculata]QJC30717.1 exodeoxyribonuclease III [Enterobacteriaceae endosymbiont of Macroplea appendiculata]
MKILSFNINGIRAHWHQLKYIIKIHNPDIIGLQETKVDNLLFPKKELLELGYNIYINGQKKNYGVALLSRYKPLKIKNDVLNNNEQKRFIMIEIPTTIGDITIINCYFPQGDNRNNFIKFTQKINFFKNLYYYINNNFITTDFIIIIGDINVSITNLDIGIDINNQKKWLQQGKCSFLPEERMCVQKLLNWGFLDIWREMNPTINNKFSWFDYRNKGYNHNIGLRIDIIFISKKLKKYYINADIDYDIRNMNRPSDHAPIWLDLNIF